MVQGAKLFLSKQRLQISASMVQVLLFVSYCLVVASWPSCGEAMVNGIHETFGTGNLFGEAISRRTLAESVNSTQTLLEDSEALLVFKAAITKDPFNVTKYWKPQGKKQVLNACRWVGITCTKRRVTGVDLFNQSLEGSVSAELGRLANLTALNLSSNSFSGGIPAELTAASSLQILDVGGNILTGPLPSSLGDLKSLTSLNVADNNLTGSIPISISNLTSLKTLNISRNLLEGTIPVDLGKALSLEVLDMSKNNLSGTIPTGLGGLKNLTVLNMGGNSLSGTIPPPMGNWTSLVTFDLSSNSLSGDIPPTIGDLQLLQILRLPNNFLTGVIPSELTGCPKLTEIDLSNNTLRGTIPFRSLESLTILRLQNNELNGDFVNNIGTFPVLEEVDLTNNGLNGSIPISIGNLPLKSKLALGHNNLTGSIPDGVGKLTLVQSINFSSNQLTGTIPNAMSECLGLAVLDLSSNSLTGAFPDISSLTSLNALNISHNALDGSLPTLNKLSNLKSLDASYNNFSGSIPSTFANFTSLLFLNVSDNKLSGKIPSFTSHDNVTAQSFLNNSLCGAILNIGCSNDKSSRNKIIYIVVGCVGGLIVAISVLFLCLFLWKRRNKKGSKHSAQVSTELQLKLTPEEIVLAINSFSEGNYIGAGMISTVYRGVLPDETVVAVKRLAINKGEGKEDAEKNLDNELEVLGHIRHRSLVQVLGYCSSPEVKALVLEYMPNGSMNSLLHPPQESEVVREFDWTLRFDSAICVAQGLKYLHHDRRIPIVHGDVKPSNILFNAKMEAKIADFGVARIMAEQGFGHSTSASMSASSAHGYIPPEVAASGITSAKGDVYSFGIVVLELITGRNPLTIESGQTLPQWVRMTVSNSKALEHVLDPILRTDIGTHQQKIAMVLGVALLCSRDNPQERPHMEDVLKMLTHIRSRRAESKRRGLGGSRQSSGPLRRNTSEKVLPPPSPPEDPLPHNPSLSDWTPSKEDEGSQTSAQNL